MTHWLAHVLGIDTQQSWWYDAWSGCIPAITTQISLTGAAWAVVRRSNCHVRRCWRIGRHHEGAHVLCHRHHHTGALSAAQARKAGVP